MILNGKYRVQKGTYRCEVSNSCYRLYDKDNNLIYYEDDTGYWSKSEYKNNKRIFFRNSLREYELKAYISDNLVYHEKNNKVLIGEL